MVCFTLLQTYKVLKLPERSRNANTVLHSYKLTRFSNLPVNDGTVHEVLHSYKLTRFSNGWNTVMLTMFVLHSYKLTRFSNGLPTAWQLLRFYTLTNLQGSQTNIIIKTIYSSFTLLQTYKVLKPRNIFELLKIVLHSYKLTRFSNLK